MIKKLGRKIVETIFNRLHSKYYLNLDDYIILPKKNLQYANDNLYTYNNASFKEESEFRRIYELVKIVDDGHILSDVDIEWRIHVMCWAANICRHIDGDYVECGVNTGMFARAIIEKINFNDLGKTYYLLDTFDGMDPRYSTEKEIKFGQLMGYGKDPDLFNKVVDTFKGYKCKIIKGSIPDTLPEVESEKIAYLCIDLNSVIPELEALKFFWSRIEYGGIVILDDYTNPGKDKQKAAHDQFIASVGQEILSLPTGQGLILKTRND